MTTSTPSLDTTDQEEQAGASNQLAEPPSQHEAIIINVPQADQSSEGGWSDAAASIASSLAWPLTLILLLVIFRAPVTRLIDRLRAFKGPGLEMSTETMIEEELPVRQPEVGSPEIDPCSSPIDTIVTAWVNVEKAARDAAIRSLPEFSDPPRTMPYSTVLRNIAALEKAGLLKNPEVRPLISDLAKIRNQAVHRPDEQISRDALIQFVSNANWAVVKLHEVMAR